MTCGRCGTPLVPLQDLAQAAREALAALRGAGRRPDALAINLVFLAAGLACHANACRSPEAQAVASEAAPAVAEGAAP